MSPLIGLILFQASTTGLDTLDLSPMTNGWSRPHVNRSIEGKPLTLGGKIFEHGIGAHAPSRLNLKLDRATAFDATVGVDDETGGKGSVEFIAVVDGTIKWRSGVLKGGSAPKTVHLDLTGAKTLALLANDGGDGSGYDHADWADARIAGSGAAPTPVRDLRPIRIETAHAALALFVDVEGRLFQRSFGAKTADETNAQVAYPTAGDGWTFEPALRATHADGNTSTDLRVTNTSQQGDTTKIELKDPAYPLFVDIYFRTVGQDDVIETWTEVHHQENGTVTLDGFASSAPDFGDDDFYLTQFHGDWADEANLAEEKLGFGIKILDSKLGVRAHQFRAPWFLLSKGGPAQEDKGEVFGGSLAWSGSFQFAFEKIPPSGYVMGRERSGRLRATCGMNPFASAYHLKAGQKFETPKMVWGWSDKGTGDLSRKLHAYVRSDVIRDGDKPRAVLLNNWEATYFTFDEKKIVSLFDGAKALGMELFLLDDGWFGVKYPRDGDTQGLGDWTPDPKKLPNGLGALTTAAEKEGLRFGLWFEPEMVNPKSELFEKHPDWLIQQPKRTFDLSRNQMILDLSNPKVEEYAFHLVDDTLSKNPGITYVKWDCNRFVTQPGSPYLGKDRQSHLWIDYVHALYRVMDRLAKKHSNVEIMMCSGGGGRVDYGSMRYAQEYWPSDMTDPARRIFIQWGYSFFFPAITGSNHVTLAGGHGMKFAFDVAMSGRLGMDVDVDKLSVEDREASKAAIATYKSIRDLVQMGEQYRLESPYDGPRSGLMYTKGDRAVAFAYSLGDAPAGGLKLKGLGDFKEYHVREINLAPGQTGIDVKMSGALLEGQGIPLPAMGKYTSHVFEITGS
jgi:alpha-galactosidase